MSVVFANEKKQKQNQKPCGHRKMKKPEKIGGKKKRFIKDVFQRDVMGTLILYIIKIVLFAGSLLLTPI